MHSLLDMYDKASRYKDVFCKAGTRWLMVQCAHTACRHDPRMRRLYERHEKRKGGKCAVVTVAHEMARIIFYMLRRVELYRGVNVALLERKLLC